MNLTPLLLLILLAGSTPVPSPNQAKLDRDLLAAARAGSAPRATELLAHGASVDARDGRQNTPAMIAAQAGNAPLLAVILRQEPNLALHNQNGETAFSLAIASGHPTIAEMMAVSLSNQWLPYRKGEPLLSFACAVGDVAAVRALLHRGASLRSREGADGMMVACVYGQEALIDFLRAHGADINQHGSGGGTALMVAATGTVRKGPDDLRIAQKLLKEGAQVNARADNGMTPLLCAAQVGGLKMMVLLIQHGANIHARNGRGQDAAAIARAAGLGTADAIAALLQRAAAHHKGNQH